MNHASVVIVSSLFSVFALGAVACGGATDPAPPVTPPTPARSTLVYKAPCASASCPGSPGGMASSYTCAAAKSDATCGWADTSARSNDAVSYRECDASECAGHEASKECPVNTHFGGLRCGSENDATCSSYATCVPDELPPSGPPCAPDACGAIIDIAEQCADGTYAGLVCKRIGTECKVGSGCAK